MKQQKSKAFRGREKPSLPADFPSALLAAEFELEKRCTVQSVNQLVGLYQQAIEFYEHLGDSRFVDYQARMHKMFMRPDVQMQLNPQSPSTASDSPVRPQAPKLRREVPARTEVPTRQARKLEQLFEVQKKTTGSACSNVKRDVADQHKQLSNRLAQRKLNKSTLDTSKSSVGNMNATFDCCEQSGSGTVSFSFIEEMQQEEQREAERRRRCVASQQSTSLLSTSTGDASPPFSFDSDKALRTSPKHIHSFAKQIEEVMERIYSERAAKEAEIKVKYETQIAELEREMNGSDFMRKIVENMRAEMQKETEKLWREMDALRKKEVQAITEEYTG